jgi:predicted Abi (CAAX) family protease
MMLNYFANLSVIQVIIQRLSAAITTVPDTQGWLYGMGLLFLFTIIALPIGFRWEFLQFEALRATWNDILGIVITSLWMPALIEELVFRVLLLPRTTENLPIGLVWFWVGISLVLFIVYHPLNAISFFPSGRDTFFNLIFLTLAGLLGFVCSLAYLQSGSLWTPVFIHWLVVAVWLLLLGGYGKLYRSPQT